jgi:hypothetical protein
LPAYQLLPQPKPIWELLCLCRQERGNNEESISLSLHVILTGLLICFGFFQRNISREISKVGKGSCNPRTRGREEEVQVRNLYQDSQVWWCTPEIPALRRLRKEDLEFKASLLHSEPISKQKKPIFCMGIVG